MHLNLSIVPKGLNSLEFYLYRPSKVSPCRCPCILCFSCLKGSFEMRAIDGGTGFFAGCRDLQSRTSAAGLSFPSRRLSMMISIQSASETFWSVKFLEVRVKVVPSIETKCTPPWGCSHHLTITPRSGYDFIHWFLRDLRLSMSSVERYCS